MRFLREHHEDVARAIRRMPPQRSREWTRSPTAQLSRLFLPPPPARHPTSSPSPRAAKEVRCLWSPKGMDARALQYKCYCAFSSERLCHCSERARCIANQPLGNIVKRSGKTKVWSPYLHSPQCWSAAARLRPQAPCRHRDAYLEASTARGTH